MNAVKTCSKCKEPKPVGEFQRCSAASDGLQSRCKTCRKAEKPNPETKAQWRENNREHLRNQGREFYARHADRLREKGRANYLQNPDKFKSATKMYRIRNPNSRHATDLKTKYGISFAEYTELLLAQGGHCALCDVTPETNGKHKGRLCVDHDHVTGRVRGLLCDKHNRAIGLFGDDPDMLLLAVEYLSKSLSINTKVA